MHDKCLHEVCGSRINSCIVHDLMTWLTVDDVDGEGRVTVWGVEGVSVGCRAIVDVGGVVVSEVLLSEKQHIVMDP